MMLILLNVVVVECLLGLKTMQPYIVYNAEINGENSMNKHIVVAASEDYRPGLQALLASFDRYHPETDIKVHLLNYNVSQNFLDIAIKKYPFLKITDLKAPASWNKVWQTKIERFNFVQSLTDLVMLLDADMFFCANIDRWFDLAARGYIVAGSNGSNVRYTEAWREKYEMDIPLGMNYKTITSVPTILDMAKHGILWQEIYNHKLQRKQGSDFDLINVFIAMHNKFKDLLIYPCQSMTQVHHFGVKLDTRIIKIDDKLMTADGQEVFTVHGKFWSKGWLDGLMKPMYNYARGREDIVKKAEKSRDILLEEFNRYQ